MSEMDTNLLFEKFTIDEIRNIEKRTRYAFSFLILLKYDHRVSLVCILAPDHLMDHQLLETHHD